MLMFVNQPFVSSPADGIAAAKGRPLTTHREDIQLDHSKANEELRRQNEEFIPTPHVHSRQSFRISAFILLHFLMNELKFALRQLLKNPGFTAVAVLTLALGIGSTTAIFSVVYGVLIDPYPYARSEEIWVPGVTTADNTQTMRSFRKDEVDAMAALPAFSDVMATSPDGALLTGEFAPQNLTAPRLTSNAFQFLGVPPVLGRTFGPGDYSASGEPDW
jgi:hypothetical protein